MGRTNFGSLGIGGFANQVTGQAGTAAQIPIRLALVNAADVDADYYLNDQSLASGGTVTVNLTPTGGYARNLTIVASGSTTAVVVVSGLDVNGFPITESFTLNGNTPVVGKKAFSKVTTVALPTVAARTIDLGMGTKFGLPFRMIENTVLKELEDGAAASAGTFTLGVTTTGYDYYGLWVPNSTPNGALDFVLYYIPTDLESAGVNN